MDENAYVGEIRLFAGSFEPRSWAFCNGQLIAIAQNTALFSLLGTMYGGNGTTTFQLPNLNGNAALGAGNSAWGTSFTQGETGGQTRVTLTTNNIPPHTHAAQGVTTPGAFSTAGTQNSPVGNYPAKPSDDSTEYLGGTSNVQMGQSPVAVTVDITGSSAPFPITTVQPTAGMNYIICLRGIFPDRP